MLLPIGVMNLPLLLQVTTTEPDEMPHVQRSYRIARTANEEKDTAMFAPQQ